jgi:hypothetical protein
MKIHSPSSNGLTLVELSVTAGLVGVLGLIIYSLLNIGTILGAKNTATNTAHQQARVAMLEMIQDLHSSVSLPAMTNASGTPYPSPAPAYAAGISFQQWSMGPFKIIADTSPVPSSSPPGVSQNFIMITLPGPSPQPRPAVGQRLIVQTHQVEGDITAVSGTDDNLKITLANMPGPSPALAPTPVPGTLPVRIQGTTAGVAPSANGDVVCYITDRCSYRVVVDSSGPPIVYKLQWNKVSDVNADGTPKFRDIVTDITNPTPFSIPLTPAGALYNRFVAAIDLSTSDPKYTNRGYKAANILLNGQVPFKARLTTYQ